MPEVIERFDGQWEPAPEEMQPEPALLELSLKDATVSVKDLDGEGCIVWEGELRTHIFSWPPKAEPWPVEQLLRIAPQGIRVRVTIEPLEPLPS